MKQRGVWALLFLCAAFPLSAQIRVDMSVYVPPVSGVGSAPEDNAAFTALLKSKLIERHFTLTDTPEEAGYILKGTLVPPELRGEDSPGEGQFLFSIDLQDTDGTALYSQDIYYTNTEETGFHLPEALDNMLAVYLDESGDGTAATDAVDGNTADNASAENLIDTDQNLEDIITGQISMYVPPVSGTGSAPGDNAAFTELLKRELAARGIVLAQTPDEADYILKGTLVPPDLFDTPAEGDASVDRRLFLFSIDLQDRDGVILFSWDIYYYSFEDVNNYIPEMLNNMLPPLLDLNADSGDAEKSGGNETREPGETVTVQTGETAAPVDPDAWRNRQWYFGGGIFWTPRLYFGTQLSSNLFNFGLRLSAEYHFPKYLSIESGLELAPDWVVASPGNGDSYRNMILQIPVSVGMIIKPGDKPGDKPSGKFMLKPYAGFLFNIPFFPDTTPALFSWKAGFEFGVKAGPGIFCVDSGFSMDFGTSGLSRNRPSDTRQYHRYIMYLGIGYKYGI